MGLFGALLGIVTAFSWASSSIIHPHISRTLGVHSCMIVRQPLAVALLALLCLLTQQFSVVSTPTLLIAFISGILGAALADCCIFESVLRVGIRTALVCASLSSCFTALLSFLFLDEHINTQGILGILMATAGVMLVIFVEHNHAPAAGTQKPSTKQELIGISLALCGAFALALAFITSKMALNGGMSPLYLGLWRNLSSGIIIWFFAVYVRNIKSTWRNLKKHPELYKFFFLGCLFGPVGGVWLASVALLYAPAAIVATLIGLQPIASTIINGFIERRLPSLGSVVGSCIACAGAAILLLRN